ncbi:hypothetical protein IWX50DRAFT_167713 [Phyllosticta citricarpa]|uniref:Transmembrane protein n=1 Tax=Phyllosticta citricarpa TaxID=55181 RepID=A0ABR1M616_9PEZI
MTSRRFRSLESVSRGFASFPTRPLLSRSLSFLPLVCHLYRQHGWLSTFTFYGAWFYFSQALILFRACILRLMTFLLLQSFHACTFTTWARWFYYFGCFHTVECSASSHRRLGRFCWQLQGFRVSPLLHHGMFFFLCIPCLRGDSQALQIGSWAALHSGVSCGC